MNNNQIDSLLKPSAYPYPTTAVRMQQTHVSLLFLTDQFVYKVKKAVNLGFLDFTTLERRFFYCKEELRLNRRLAPEIYLDVVPVRATPHGASFDGDGEIIDYAVRMVRLPEERMMSRLLEQGAITADNVRTLAGNVARFHLAAATSPEISGYGAPAIVRANWEENFDIVDRFVGQTVTHDDFRLIRKWVEEFLEHNEALFERRVSEGFIREGDGDLHAGNICLTEPPVIFDCIEFNERFRYLDTAADIAFLLMDLEYYRSGRFAALFIDEYRAITGDEGIHRLLPFYQVYRAFIRGEVESIKAAEPELSDAERDASGESARRHFCLARGLIIRDRLPQTLFITCGFSGSGKSTVASELSFQLGLEQYSSDLVRKELAGISPTERRSGDYLDGIYGHEFTRKTYDRLRELAEDALTAGRSAIVDATFRNVRERALFQALASVHSARFVILAICCSQTVILERLDDREHRSDVVSDARRTTYYRQKNDFVPPQFTEGEVITVDTASSLMHTMDALLTSLGVLPCGHNSNGYS
jgi:aminoglycoside phosphotransferase family enzyme/predicted kinase